jgi:hypothetical protein
LLTNCHKDVDVRPKAGHDKPERLEDSCSRHQECKQY